MKKNLVLLSLLLILPVSGCTSYLTKSTPSSQTPQITQDIQNEPSVENEFPSFEEEIASMDFLTTEEKDRLIRSEREKDPLYDELEQLSAKADEIQIQLEKKIEALTSNEKDLQHQSEALAQQIDALYEKINSIDDNNADLWEKISEQAEPIVIPYKK